MNEVEKSVDPLIWHLCACGMIRLPLPNSNVYYFPQGHAEHTHTNVDFGEIARVPYILCKVIDVKLMADELYEVSAKIILSPLDHSIIDLDVDDGGNLVDSRIVSEFPGKLLYFAKILSESDAYGFRGLYLPRDWAEAVFPKLDYSVHPTAQIVMIKDIHGEIWKFRHVYRGNPTRHMLTKWTAFAKQKSLNAGDLIVFMRADNGDVCVGIRRTKLENINSSGRGKVRPEDVIEAVSRAASGQPFEVTYYPHASTPEFVVNASFVNAALRVQWCAGMRFTMAYETESLSQSWPAGTVSSVQAVDPILWPDSPWRVLQVDLDYDQDQLKEVKRVSPWLVKLASNNPSTHFPAPHGARQAHELEPGNNDLTICSCNPNLKGICDKPAFRLFGQPIHIYQPDDYSTNPCEVFLGPDNECLGTLDFNAIESYQNVEETVADWFDAEKLDDSTRVIYKDSAGVEKQMGDEPFGEFVTKVKRLTVLKDVR